MGDLIVLRDLLIILASGLVVVALLRRIALPPIAGFIVAGALIGPGGLGVIAGHGEVEMLAEIGVVALLFGIGVELDLSRMRRLWRPLAAAGAIQIGLTLALSAGVGLLAGLPPTTAVFAGMLVALSSTAIALRELQARGELEAPHGSFALGILIFQDLSVVPMILAIPLLAGAGADAASLAIAFGKALAVLVGALAAARLIAPRALAAAAASRQRDLFVLAVVLICIGTAWIVSRAGLSLAVGAFLAGLVVAGSEYRHQALSELIPFRELFTSLFFVSIGMLFEPAVLVGDGLLVLGLFAALVGGKFAIVFATAAVLRLPLRVCILAGVTLAQVGEFAFVLLHAATGTNLMPASVAVPLVAAVILSMLVTPLALTLGPRLAAGADRIRPLSRLLGVRPAYDAGQIGEPHRDHIIIAGYGYTGQHLARSLAACGIPYLILDLNPDNVRLAQGTGEPAYFGDVTSPDVLAHIGVSEARQVVLAINDTTALGRAIAAIRRVAPEVPILVRARFLIDADALFAAGASDVVIAELEAAAEVSARVLRNCDVTDERVIGQLDRIRSRHAEPHVDSPPA